MPLHALYAFMAWTGTSLPFSPFVCVRVPLNGCAVHKNAPHSERCVVVLPVIIIIIIIIIISTEFVGRDSAVGIVTRHGLDGHGIVPWRGGGGSCFPYPSRTVLGPIQPLVK
jgi:hypothetical protein